MNTDAIGISLCGQIDANEAILLTRELVQVPSVSPNEAACALLLSQRYEEYGLDVTLHEAAPGRPNVIGTIEGSGKGGRLLIVGHTDVVEVGEELQWSKDPWGGQIFGARLYGRGALDVKAGLASAAIAARAIIAAGIRLKGTLQLAGFVDGERLMAGARSFKRAGHTKDLDATISLEPSFGLGIRTCTLNKLHAADIVQAAQRAHKQITKKDAPIDHIPGTPTRCGHFSKASTVLQATVLGVPSMSIGLSGANAHMPDEYVHANEISVLAKILALTVLDYLGYE